MRHLKTGTLPSVRAEQGRAVQTAVEAILEDIEHRGDAAVRDLSIRFDGWNRESYRLTPAEIQDCIDQLDSQAISDIEFAQTQVRRFAEV
ncbi:MAG: histidinol dehydrogenase, partial [Oxalobacteraceae bacterium]